MAKLGPEFRGKLPPGAANTLDGVRVKGDVLLSLCEDIKEGDFHEVLAHYLAEDILRVIPVREALASNLKVSVDKLSAQDPLSVLSDEDQEFLKNIRNASPEKQREVRKILFKAAMITGGKALAEAQGMNGPHHPEPGNAA